VVQFYAGWTVVNVVIEGPDGGGKSTLARTLSDALDMRVQQGSGPPKRPGEIERRTRDYLAMRSTLFDRHPCVSQTMYGQLRGETLSPDMASLIIDFYRSPVLFVYCRSTDDSRHVVKEGENPQHIKLLHSQYDTLVSLYDRWALRHARLIYRIGDDVEELTDIIRVIAC
jgi:hypothetical protein